MNIMFSNNQTQTDIVNFSDRLFFPQNVFKLYFIYLQKYLEGLFSNSQRELKKIFCQNDFDTVSVSKKKIHIFHRKLFKIPFV